MKQKRETLRLECNLTESELLRYSDDMSKALIQVKNQESILNDAKISAKNNIGFLEENIGILSVKVSEKKETREVDCIIQYDYKNNRKTWIRTDTNEIVKQKSIPDEERQQEMEFAS